MALEGQKGDPRMWGNGTSRVRWRNWMVLDQRTARMAPDVEKVTSVQQRCLLGSNLFKDGINKFDFLKKEKNPTKQAAQNVMSNGLPRLSNCKIPFRTEAVMGSFWHVLSPFFLLKQSLKTSYLSTDWGVQIQLAAVWPHLNIDV